jgi:hypothetical protein
LKYRYKQDNKIQKSTKLCLRNKLNYIADIIEEFDIVFFTETHLDNQVLDSDIIIDGFETPSRKDRDS